MIIKPMKKLFLVVVLILCNNFIRAANRFWISGGTGNWNSTTNWSTTSGGASGASVPGSGDVANFDGSGVANCSINATVGVSGINIIAGYTGTITQQTGFTISCTTYSQADGIFTGGNSTISITTFTLSGGAFTTTTNTLTITGAYTFSGGTFAHNTGTVRFNNSSTITLTGTTTFNNLTFTNSAGVSSYTIASGTTFTVNGTLALQGSSELAIHTGIIDALGSITVTNNKTSASAGGTATINIIGTGNQTLTGSGVTNGGPLPNIVINKPSGTLTLASIITVRGSWTYTQGTISAGTSTVVFNVTKTITGSHTLANVNFSSFNGTAVFTIASGTTITVPGTLTLSGVPSITINTGTIDAKGDITVTTASTSSAAGGTGTIHINGTGNQTMTGSGVVRGGALPKVNIDKSSGTLFLVSIITVRGDWTYTQGTLDIGTSTVVFDKTLTITGTHTLANVSFYAQLASVTYTIFSGTILTCTGTLTYEGSNTLTLNIGTVEAQGDITINNTGLNGGGTATILIDGNATQVFSSSVAAGQGNLPNITISKTGGALNMNGTISVVGNWVYTTGTVDATTGSSIVYFTTAKNIDAQGVISTMAFYNITLGDATVRTLLGNVIINNVLSLGTGIINLNGNTCIMTFNSTGAITLSSGYIISESINNSGKISWNIGSAMGSYIYPFSTTGGTFIPFTFQLTAGDAGYVTVATYPTALDNTPYPTTPDNVTNLAAIDTTDNSSNVIDRFWQIDKTGPSGTATITYTYAQSEVSGGVIGNEASLQAQRYDVTKNTWDDALSGQSADGIANTVIEPDITLFSPRTLSISGNSLPIELLSFDAMPTDNNVILTWKTAMEINNNYYTVERSTDAFTYKDIGFMDGAGNSISVLNYSLVDENPSKGVSYYRLKQTDFDGKYTYSKVRSVNFENTGIFDFSIYPNPIYNRSGSLSFTLSGLKKDFSILVELLDVLGKVCYSKIVYTNSNGCAKVTIESNNPVPMGVYMIRVISNNKLFSKKVVVE